MERGEGMTREREVEIANFIMKGLRETLAQVTAERDFLFRENMQDLRQMQPSVTEAEMWAEIRRDMKKEEKDEVD